MSQKYISLTEALGMDRIPENTFVLIPLDEVGAIVGHEVRSLGPLTSTDANIKVERYFAGSLKYKDGQLVIRQLYKSENPIDEGEFLRPADLIDELVGIRGSEVIDKVFRVDKYKRKK